MVSLRDAWDSGAAAWSATRRRLFANDAANLLATSAAITAAKGDRGPDQWRPQHHPGWCRYGGVYEATKQQHGLTLTGGAAGRVARAVCRMPAAAGSGGGNAMKEHELPTWDDIVDRALNSLNSSRNALSEARDWLRSDWRPLGSPSPDAAADARSDVLELVGEAKALIDRAKETLYRASGRS